jgi:hypothetical protein
MSKKYQNEPKDRSIKDARERGSLIWYEKHVDLPNKNHAIALTGSEWKEHIESYDVLSTLTHLHIYEFDETNERKTEDMLKSLRNNCTRKYHKREKKVNRKHKFAYHRKDKKDCFIDLICGDIRTYWHTDLGDIKINIIDFDLCNQPKTSLIKTYLYTLKMNKEILSDIILLRFCFCLSRLNSKNKYIINNKKDVTDYIRLGLDDTFNILDTWGPEDYQNNGSNTKMMYVCFILQKTLELTVREEMALIHSMRGEIQ